MLLKKGRRGMSRMKNGGGRGNILLGMGGDMIK